MQMYGEGSYPLMSDKHMLEEIYHDDGDEFCVTRYSEQKAVARCNCMVKLNCVRSVGPDYLRLIEVSPEGLAPPVYEPHTLRELAVSAVASQVIRCKEPSEYDRWMAAIKELPRYVYESLLGVGAWGYAYFEGLRRMVVRLRPIRPPPRYDFSDLERRLGRHLVPLQVRVYNIKNFQRRYRIACNRPWYV
jgi:hypothetical protein